ncbi:MAG: 4'-phosphopantetheinyl transferase superfamily protein [Acholeplasmatales bacterium]|nr:4'-phosphopantetheinyl transferase superfamily protein [Acholeplasmatales bacterium]
MENEVMLHIVDLNDYPDFDIDSLSYVTKEDMMEAKRYKQLQDLQQHLVSQYFKRKYVPDFYNLPSGKPISHTKCFNISHSHNLIIYAEADVNVGIDIELVKKSDDRIRKYISNDNEFEFIKTDEDFYRIWTSKESLVKCYGSGIVDDVKSIPAIPINGRKFYKEEKFYTRNLKYNDFILSITINKDEYFEINFIEEELEFNK